MSFKQIFSPNPELNAQRGFENIPTAKNISPVANSKMSECFQICIRFGSLNLNDSNIRDLCLKYGEIKRLYLPNSANMRGLAFVGYQTIREAENAIEGLNNSNLGLNVVHSRSSGANKSNNNSRSIEVNTLKQRLFQNNRNDNSDLQKSNQLLNKKSEDSCSVNSNSSTSNELFDDKCSLCKNVAEMLCDRCESSYCSVECQAKDWLTHRFVCFRMPILRKKNEHHKTASPHAINNVVPTNINIPSLNRNTTSVKNEMNIVNVVPSANIQDSLKYSSTENYSKIIATKITPPSSNIMIEVAKFPKNNSFVQITSFEHDKCFIRSMDKTLNSEYINVLRDIDNYSANAKFIKKPPSNGNIVLANFQNTGYYRALIINADNINKIKISYLDFGNTDIQSYEKFKELDIDLQKSKRFIHSIILKNIDFSNLNEKVLDYMKEFVDNCTDLKIVYDDEYIPNKTQCELLLASNNESLNKEINNLLIVKKQPPPSPLLPISNNHTEKLIQLDEPFEPKKTPISQHLVTQPAPVESAKAIQINDPVRVESVTLALQTSNSSVYYDPIKKTFVNRVQTIKPEDLAVHKIADQENVEIYILDKTYLKAGFLHCTDKPGMEKFSALLEKLTNYGDNVMEPFKPKEHELCIVYFEEMWTRGLCIKELGERSSIFFIDFGNSSEVNNKDIRAYSNEFTEPQFATACSIADLPEKMDEVYLKTLDDALPPLEPIVADKIENVVDTNGVATKEPIIYLTTIRKRMEN